MFDLVITEPVADRLWFGMADYGAGSWRFSRGADGVLNTSISGECMHTPAGYCNFVIVALNELVVQINSLTVVLDLPDWNIQTVDDQDEPGMMAGLAVIADRPLIVYSAWATSELRVARSTVPVPDSPSDWERSTLIDGFHVGRIDLRLINGLPAVGFVNQTTMMLTYARALTADPSGPADWVVMPLTGVVGTDEFALAEIAGNPAFVYVRSGLGGEDQIDYTIATIPAPADATDWESGKAVPETIATHHFKWLSLLHPAELPVFTYYSTLSDQLLYQHSSLTAPLLPGDWEACGVDSDPNAGGWSNLISYDDQPAVAYTFLDDNTLRLARSASWTPALPADWQVHCADPGYYIVGNLGLAAINDGLGLAYHVPNGYEELRYAWASATPAATGDWSIVVVDENIGLGSANPLVELANGQPALTYMDADHKILRFATIIP